MTEHTPGPWHAECPENGAFHVSATAAGPGDVCDLYHPYTDESGKHIFTKDRARANAHLIAAAPDMYAELESMAVQVRAAGEHGLFENWEPAYERAQAALAKAKGVTP